MFFHTSCRASEYSCMQILDIVYRFYLFSTPTRIMYKFFLTRKKSTRTPITEIHCINDAIPNLFLLFLFFWGLEKNYVERIDLCFSFPNAFLDMQTFLGIDKVLEIIQGELTKNISELTEIDRRIKKTTKS